MVDPGDVSRDGRRLAIYAISGGRTSVDDFVLHALDSLRAHVGRLVVVVPSGYAAADCAVLRDRADDVLISTEADFEPAVYPWAIDQLDEGLIAFDEIVLTGDSWFGPINDFGPVLERMSDDPAQIWAMTQNAQGARESFPIAGFPSKLYPWVWTTIRREVFLSPEWSTYWAEHRSFDARVAQEEHLPAHFASLGRSVSYAFPAVDYPSNDPAFFTPTLLLDDGCPTLARAVFAAYPPYLDRFAVIGRTILARVEELGFPMALVWQGLSRTVPPKALNATAGMLEVLPDVDLSYDRDRAFRIAAIIHVTDLAAVDEILTRLSFLPNPYDLYLTTTDGQRATELHRLVEARGDERVGSVDVRVTPASKGRDMSDFFVGCRDVLLGGEHDLIVKVHARRMRRKTVNVRRYFRRYQLENLLNSPGYVANVLALFQREPGLGVVFPPMMHIGYSTMGNGWGGLRPTAEQVTQKLGISVPLDHLSPLAPFGGMWIGRPEALRVLSSQRWRYGDYSSRGGLKYRNLAHLQERLIAYAAAESGFHSRTVLTREHAAISHTALESKVDNLFSTTRGWPVEQIQLMQRAGATGHGGIVALSRMYLRLNHPRISRVLMPVYELAFRSFIALRTVRVGARRLVAMLMGRPTEGIR